MEKVAIAKAQIILWRTHCILLSCQPVGFYFSLYVVLWLSSKYHIPLSAWYLKPVGRTPLPSIMLHCFTRNMTSFTADMLIPRKLFFTFYCVDFKNIFILDTKEKNVTQLNLLKQLIGLYMLLLSLEMNVF